MAKLSENTKGYLAFAAFILALPALYLAPTLLNAIVDIFAKL